MERKRRGKGREGKKERKREDGERIWERTQIFDNGTDCPLK